MTEYGTNISAGRVYKELKVPLLMKGMQLPKMSTVKPKLSTTKIDQGLPCLNLLKQQFNPCVPNQVWVSDITYIKAGTRFCYLCVIIDLFARKVIAYDVSYSINTELVLSVFDKAYVARRMPCGVMFHSDRGVQYTACKFRQRLDQVNFVQSFSAKAYPFDNAVAESFFKFLKHEETSRKSFPDIHQLELALFEYMNFYNAHRPHSANNRLNPDQKKSLFTS